MVISSGTLTITHLYALWLVCLCRAIYVVCQICLMQTAAESLPTEIRAVHQHEQVELRWYWR